MYHNENDINWRCPITKGSERHLKLLILRVLEQVQHVIISISKMDRFGETASMPRMPKMFKKFNTELTDYSVSHTDKTGPYAKNLEVDALVVGAGFGKSA